jgi:hypothetical protein
MTYYGIWVTRDDGDHGWLTIHDVVYWAPIFPIALAQIKYIELNGNTDETYKVSIFDDFDFPPFLTFN